MGLVQQENKIILASASPRRRAILEAAGVSFAVHAADIDESVPKTVEPTLAVQLLACTKAAAVHAENAYVIGADTVVVLDGEILGKPRDAADAVAMLRRLSGKTHSVLTGMSIIRTADGRMSACCAEAAVTFRALTDAEIEAYAATGEPLDKAGAYGIQGEGGKLVAACKGDIQTVIGLPFKTLQAMFKKDFGIEVGR